MAPAFWAKASAGVCWGQPGSVLIGRLRAGIGQGVKATGARVLTAFGVVFALEAGAVSAVAPLRAPQPFAAPAERAAVTGFAWSVAGDPIAGAMVRLRNILTGLIVAQAVTNRDGGFVFENIPGGATYIVELVNERGAVRAVGHQFTAAPGDTVATFVRLGVPAPWLTGVLGNAAALVVSTAATIGIPASVPPEQPISPIR